MPSPESGINGSSSTDETTRRSFGLGLKPMPAFGAASPFGTACRHDTPLSSGTATAAIKSASTERPSKRIKLDFLRQVQVIVGDNEQTFYVPLNLVTGRSTLETRSEDAKKAVTLPSYDTAVFSIYLQLLYHREVVVAEDESSLEREQLWVLLAKVWTLADHLQDVIAADTVIDEMVNRLKICDVANEPVAAAIEYSFLHTDVGSPLQNVFVDWTMLRSSDQTALHGAPILFLEHLARSFMTWRDRCGFGFVGQNTFGDRPMAYHLSHLGKE